MRWPKMIRMTGLILFIVLLGSNTVAQPEPDPATGIILGPYVVSFDPELKGSSFENYTINVLPPINDTDRMIYTLKVNSSIGGVDYLCTDVPFNYDHPAHCKSPEEIVCVDTIRIYVYQHLKIMNQTKLKSRLYQNMLGSTNAENEELLLSNITIDSEPGALCVLATKTANGHKGYFEHWMAEYPLDPISTVYYHSYAMVEISSTRLTGWMDSIHIQRVDEKPRLSSQPKEDLTKYAKYWNDKGESYLEQNDFNNSVRCFDRAVELGSKDPIYAEDEALAFSRAGEYDKAVKCWDNAIALMSANNPNAANAWYNKGLDLTKAGRLAEANVAFANAKEIDPEEFAKEENYRKTGNWYNLSSPVSSPGLTNEPPDASSLTPDKPGPQLAGNAITWTAVASDPENDPLVFKFFLNGPATGNQWAEQTQWVSDNIWAWTTSAKDVGNNQVSVWVRDGKHAGPEGSDGIATVDYIVM